MVSPYILRISCNAEDDLEGPIVIDRVMFQLFCDDAFLELLSN